MKQQATHSLPLEGTALNYLGRWEVVLLVLTFLVFPLDTLPSLLSGVRNVEAGEGLTLTHLTILALFAVCAWHALLSKSAKPMVLPLANAVTLFALLYFGVQVLSIMFARTRSNALGPMIPRISVFFFYLLVLYVITDRQRLRWCMVAFALCSIPMVAAGLFEMVTRIPIIPEIRFSESVVREGLHIGTRGGFRIQGLTTTPNDHGAQLSILLAFLLYTLHVARSGWRKTGVVLLFLLAVVNVAATASRGAWLTTVLALAIYFPLAPIRHKSVLLVGSIVLVVVAFVALIVFFPDLQVLDRLLNREYHGSYSVDFRRDLARVSLEMGRSGPFGVGTGNFRPEYHRFSDMAPELPKFVTPAAHNIFLAVFAENGLPGLLVYCLMHLAVGLQIVYCLRRARDTEARFMAVTVLAAYAVVLFSLNFYSLWGSKWVWTVMAMTGALAAVLNREQEQTESDGSAVAARPRRNQRLGDVPPGTSPCTPGETLE